MAHPYVVMVQILKAQRKNLIEEFRHFKRNRVNRKWLDHSAFSRTNNKFRKQIAMFDQMIAGGKAAVKKSHETGIGHVYDYQKNEVVEAGNFLS